jgi:uncharacterized protein YjbI with pentapeptide repeats
MSDALSREGDVDTRGLLVAGPWQLLLLPWEIRPPQPSLTVQLTLVACWRDGGWQYEEKPWGWSGSDDSPEDAVGQRALTPFKPACDVLLDAKLEPGRACEAVGLSLGSPPHEHTILGDVQAPDGHGLGVALHAAPWPPGRFDSVWRKTAWPFFPVDFDWAAMQLTAGQTLPYLRGDEAFSLVGARVDGSGWRGSLPGLVPRVVCRVDDTVHEAVAHLDTVIFAPERHAVCLQWRAVFEHSRAEFRRMDNLTVASHRLGEERCKAAVLLQQGEPGAERTSAPAVDQKEQEAFAASLADGVSLAPLAPAKEAPKPAKSKAITKPKATSKQVAAGDMHPDAAMLSDLHQQLQQLVPVLVMPSLVGAAVIDDSMPQPPPAAPVVSSSERMKAALGEEQGAELARLTAPEPETPSQPAADRPADMPDAPPIPSKTGSEPAVAGADYAGVDWRGRNLRGVDLRGCCLSGALLDEADLSGANLSQADLSKASLDGAVLVGAVLEGACLNAAKLSSADLSEAAADGASFDAADLRRASLHKASLCDASFVGADLSRCDLARCLAQRTSFQDARLERALLFEANLSEANLQQAVLERAMADSASAAGADFSKAVLDASSWRSACFDRTNFTKASLREASLSRSSCIEARFVAADMRQARIDQCDLQRAVLSEANLMQANMAGSNATGADFQNANLYRAAVWRAVFNETNTDGALVAATALEDA